MLTKKKIDEQALWDNAVRLMPRGTQTMSKCPDQFVDGVYPKFVKSGKGAYLYGLDGKKIYALGWNPTFDFKKSLEKTVLWTLNNLEWLEEI